MYTAPLKLDDPQYRGGTYKGGTAYARTKRMQVALARFWGEKLVSDGVHLHAMHPGWANTPGVVDSLPGFNKVMGPLLRNAEQGADTAVWLAAADEPGRSAGLFWHDRAVRPEHYLPMTKESEDERERLWEMCAAATGLTKPDSSRS
jgi:NAD(P)-dependent dehydrogenase (short-subunit alcohol dehydrogenase family)